jgi:hypothetical protein
VAERGDELECQTSINDLLGLRRVSRRRGNARTGKLKRPGLRKMLLKTGGDIVGLYLSRKTTPEA